MTKNIHYQLSPNSSTGLGGRICVSLTEPTPAACLEKLEKLQFAEVRLDGMDAAVEDVCMIFSQKKRLIATHRSGSRPQAERRILMAAAIEAGASYVDIDLHSEIKYTESLVALARKHGCRVIVSFHDHQSTPESLELKSIIRRCLGAGADIVKIACRVLRARDNARLMGLLDSEVPLVIVGMGRLGRITRIMGPFMGSLFSYASPGPGSETAPGQIDLETLQELMEAGNFV